VKRVVWTAQVWERLLEIETFIAEDSPSAAVKLLDKLIARTDTLARHPDRGRRLPEMPASGLRDLIMERHRIVNRPGRQVSEVLTVFEGHRRLRRVELPAEG
jgi:toxin ParE1/3/4